MHPSKLTLNRLRSEQNIPLLTQAWLKFFEILVEFPELTSNDDLKSLHLCEAPGAFISALVHYTKKPVDWYGSSLNPWHEGKDIFFCIFENSLTMSPGCPFLDFYKENYVHGIVINFYDNKTKLILFKRIKVKSPDQH